MGSRIANFIVGQIQKGARREGEARRLVDQQHLAFVRRLPCMAELCAGRMTYGCIAHHLTLGRNRMGRKAGDDMTVPLLPCRHNDYPNSLHLMGEAKFWNALGVDAPALAKALYQNTGDFVRCVEFMRFHANEAAARRRDGVKLFQTKRWPQRWPQ